MSDKEAGQPLGDITTIWDTCGLMGLCPDCRTKDNARGCQKHYVFARIRGAVERGTVIHQDQDDLADGEPGQPITDWLDDLLEKQE